MPSFRRALIIYTEHLVLELTSTVIIKIIYSNLKSCPFSTPLCVLFAQHTDEYVRSVCIHVLYVVIRQGNSCPAAVYIVEGRDGGMSVGQVIAYK